MVRLLRPSGLISVTHPRLPPSTNSQVPSGRATGPSGSTNPLAKTRLMLVEISASGKTPSIDSTDSLEEWDQIVTAVALESTQKSAMDGVGWPDDAATIRISPLAEIERSPYHEWQPAILKRFPLAEWAA
jgi:hypothetical protein